MEDVLTVKKLKEALQDVPDDLEVRLVSDTGVDQGLGMVIVEDAYRVNYELPDGKVSEEGLTGVDYFAIYANDRETDEEDEL